MTRGQGTFGFATAPGREELAPGAVLLRGFVLAEAAALRAAVLAVATAAPFRHFPTPGGKRMAAAMTNCGALGWVSDRDGYRYTANDPDTGAPWPAMPAVLSEVARAAARAAGADGFEPDACLVNRYEPGAAMALHQDRDENDFAQPIVSVSLGLPIRFVLGGLTRRAATSSFRLDHGDVLVFGGPARLCFHGVRKLAEGEHAQWGRCRINLTLRRAR